MKAIESKDFGNEIKRVRKKRGYTQAEISEATGFSMSFISNLENGKSTAEIGKALHVANLLGIDIILEERGE